jgi:hypothetical protein
MISKKYQATRIAMLMVSIFIFSDEFVIGVGQQTKLQELLCRWLVFSVSLEKYLTLRSVSSLNNPKNSEMKFCENMALIC